MIIGLIILLTFITPILICQVGKAHHIVRRIMFVFQHEATKECETQTMGRILR